jgi:hypothetical protein
MAIPNNKEELIQAIMENYKKLKTELETIPFELTNAMELDGHTKNSMMSINNLLAYLVGWGTLVLKWNKNKSNGVDVDFPETGFKWNQLGLLAQKFYLDFDDQNFNQLKLELESTTNSILVLIESKSNHELYETTWYDKWTLGRMIQLNTSSPFKNAKDRIRKWKKSKLIK